MVNLESSNKTLECLNLSDVPSIMRERRVREGRERREIVRRASRRERR